MNTSNSFQPFTGGLRFWGESTVRAHWGWFLALGIGLVMLGIIALAATVLTTVVSIIVLGLLLLVGGFLLLLFVLTSRSLGRALLRLMVALLALLAGWYLVVHPKNSAIALTLVMAWYFIVSGLFRLMGAIFERQVHWGWVAVSGIISIILGILLLAHWPVTGLFAIGIFVGVDLLLFGISWIIAALIMRRSAPSTLAPSPAP